MQTFLSYAFRPFFLAMAVFACVAVAIWVFVLRGMGPDVLPVNAVYWHGHEMLVGFVMAAVAGFTLTAVATWTGRPPVGGALLGLLLLCWLAGRFAMAFAGVLPATLVAGIDMLFPLLLMLLLGREVIAGGSRRNMPVVLILLLLALFNGIYHAGRLGWLPVALDAERIGLYLLTHLLLMLITVIGGRIVPAFTTNWLRARGEKRLPVVNESVERAVVLATLLTGLYAVFLPLSPFTGMLALVAGMVHLLRLARWRSLATTREPLLLMLHLAYAWLPAGYLLTAASLLGTDIPATAALHGLTIGAIAFMILAVTTRVALAHTGRPLHAARLTVLAYALLLLTAFVRVASPLGPAYLAWIDVTATGWLLSFGIFLRVYTPILLGPRVDGKA